MLGKFLSIYETRLDRVAFDTTFDVTGRKDKGEEGQTYSGFVARKRCDEKGNRVAIRVPFG